MFPKIFYNTHAVDICPPPLNLLLIEPTAEISWQALLATRAMPPSLIICSQAFTLAVFRLCLSVKSTFDLCTHKSKHLCDYLTVSLILCFLGCQDNIGVGTIFMLGGAASFISYLRICQTTPHPRTQRKWLWGPWPPWPHTCAIDYSTTKLHACMHA